MKSNFKYRNYVKEDHGSSLFGTQFNYFLKHDQPMVFASVGSNRVSVYKCTDDGGLKLVQCYADPDVSKIYDLTDISNKFHF